jgi:hypothetical protein
MAMLCHACRSKAEEATERVRRKDYRFAVLVVGQAHRLPLLGTRFHPKFVIHLMPTGAVGLQDWISGANALDNPGSRHAGKMGN